MMMIKVSEAEGRALDWLVCSCFPNASGMMRQIIERPISYIGRYSSDAALAWPIIDREKIDIEHTNSTPPLAFAKKLGDEDGASRPSRA